MQWRKGPWRFQERKERPAHNSSERFRFSELEIADRRDDRPLSSAVLSKRPPSSRETRRAGRRDVVECFFNCAVGRISSCRMYSTQRVPMAPPPFHARTGGCAVHICVFMMSPAPSLYLPPCPADPGSVSGPRSVRRLVGSRPGLSGAPSGVSVHGQPRRCQNEERKQKSKIKQRNPNEESQDGARRTDLLLVVQALVVVLEKRRALFLALLVLARRVDHVAREHLLPEGEAPAGA